jgi:hypothetical protein
MVQYFVGIKIVIVIHFVLITYKIHFMGRIVMTIFYQVLFK